MIVVELAVQKVYAVPFTVDVNCVNLSIVIDAGASPGVIVKLTFAFALLQILEYIPTSKPL